MILQPPVFILSAPRSGSTLLRVMLAGHADLFCPPELNLAEFNTLRERESKLGPCPHTACLEHLCDQRTGLNQALMELLQADHRSSREVIEVLLERGENIAAVYNLLFELAAPRRLVDKSPRYSAKLASLENSHWLFPKAKYIYIHRHPYSVIESLLRNGFEKKMTAAEQVWLDRNSNIKQFLNGVDKSQHLQVAYENLVKDPDLVMHEVCQFLGIEFDSAVLNPYDGSRMTGEVQPGRMPPGDPNFLTHNRIDPSLGDIWRAQQLPGPIGLDTLRLSATLMYDLV